MVSMVKIALKDGSKIEVEQGTTILDVAKKISEGLARVATCGEVNGEIKDLRYEIQEDSNLVIHTFNEEDLDGKKAYWHTTSHIMAQAVQRLFPNVKFAIGPSINDGFYYDFDVEKPFTDEDKAKIEEEMKKIILDVIKNYDKKNVIQDYPDGTFAEFSRNYGNDCGITVCGQYDEEDRFHVEYYYPFFHGTGVTTQEAVTVEKHVDRNAFSGACDDLRIGITLIFYLQNTAEYMKESGKEKIDNYPLILSGLAGEGKILLPVLKDKEAVKVEQESAKNRSSMIAAARNGDEEAMENLTMEEMDTYSMISTRIVNEDILSIVDSYFMPYGIQCDQYSILGEILEVHTVNNIVTDEELVQMTIESNNMQFDVCINRKDLLGDPQVGRRFKGTIWLQGQLQF